MSFIAATKVAGASIVRMGKGVGRIPCLTGRRASFHVWPAAYLAGMTLRTLSRASLAALSALTALLTTAQLNITQLGHLSYQDARNSDLSNLWGYVDEEGNEYALVGVNGDPNVDNSGGFAVVDVTDPANPVEIFFTPGPNSIWREIKTWGDHAYITTEAEGGLMIVDLSPLPQSTDLPVTVFEAPDWITSHSLFIDENGRLYLNGANRGNGGCIFYDLTQDPEAPVEVGEYDAFYVHDCFARGDTLYAAHILDGFFTIVDVSDPSNPVFMGQMETPNQFTHNCWLDDSGQYLFTTDEKPNSYLAAYDVSDPTDIQLLDQLQTDPGSDAIIHNTYWLNGYVVQSYYTEGVSIYDVSDPTNIVEVGRYDTSPFTGDGFNGAWGVYPFLPSGNLLVSDIEQGLFILGPTYTQACWLEGLITNASTSGPVDQATITITGTTAFDVTEGFDGLYSTGWGIAGTYEVTVTAAGYVDQTVQGVALQNGQVTVLDVQLVPLVPFTFAGQVIEDGTGSPIADAQVSLTNDTYGYNTTTDANGNFSVPGFFSGDYMIYAGHWGHHTACIDAQDLTQNSPALVITLPVGYADDFALDLGWSGSGNAASGTWVRDVPVGTTFGNDPCAPGDDVAADCGEMAYVTGNGGGGAGDDDVDDGFVRLESPVFDATQTVDPWIRYYRWWFTGGGNSTSNDVLLVQLDNGETLATIEGLDANAPDMSDWVMNQFEVSAFVTPTANMKFIMYTADDDPGHLVEAGLDRFEVLPASPFLAVEETSSLDVVGLYPDPSDGVFTVLAPGISGRVRVFDARGTEVNAPRRIVGGSLTIDLGAAAGLYLVRIETDNGDMRSFRMVVR
jgi:choice-of-anchor B domain-containing protein